MTGQGNVLSDLHCTTAHALVRWPLQAQCNFRNLCLVYVGRQYEFYGDVVGISKQIWLTLLGSH